MTQDKLFCENCNTIRFHDYEYGRGGGITILEWFDSVELCCNNPSYLWETDIFKPKRCEP